MWSKKMHVPNVVTFLTRVSEFYENALKTTGSIQAAPRGEARCRFVSTHPRAVSFGQDAEIASTAGGSINPRENNTDVVVPKGASDGHRHPRFFLLSHFQHTMYFGTTIQFYKDKIMQSQYTSSRTYTLQIHRRRFAPACREHFRGGVLKSSASSLRGSP
jgi:hypothetical protein